MTKNETTVWPLFTYRDARSAIAFLRDAFSFEEAVVFAREDDSSVIEHAEMRWTLGGASYSVPPAKTIHLSGSESPETTLYLVCDEPDGLYARAISAGSEVVRGLVDEDYGSRGFTVRDPEGNLWSFGSYAGSSPS